MLDTASGQLVPGVTTCALIALAEVGDKSQLVCIALAARHRAWPVLLGAILAFALLNLLAVVFGAGVAAWLPERVTAGIVAVLFAAFGIQVLRRGDHKDEEVGQRDGHGVFVTTLLLIFLAEFGDKTQIAVAGMAGTAPAIPVWIGATLALGGVSALGVLAGRTLLRRMPIVVLQRLGGALFLVLAVLAAGRALDLI